MRYRLNKRLMAMQPDETLQDGDCLVEVVGKKEYWDQYNKLVQDHMLMRSLNQAQYCKVDLLHTCDIGTFVIPDKKHILKKVKIFGYYMDKEKLIFIDDHGSVEELLNDIEKNQILEKTYVAHLFFEFLETLVKDDVSFLQDYEENLMGMEEQIMSGKVGSRQIPGEILKIRRELSRLCAYYTQLMNLGCSLSENYNNLLSPEECNLFHLFSDRVTRLVDQTKELKDYALQIREMHQTSLDEKQNNAISFLTVVTTIFMPLTLIAGWYGMNF